MTLKSDFVNVLQTLGEIETLRKTYRDHLDTETFETETTYLLCSYI